MDDFTKKIFPPPYSGPRPRNIIPDIFIEVVLGEEYVNQFIR